MIQNQFSFPNANISENCKRSPSGKYFEKGVIAKVLKISFLQNLFRRQPLPKIIDILYGLL